MQVCGELLEDEEENEEEGKEGDRTAEVGRHRYVLRNLLENVQTAHLPVEAHVVAMVIKDSKWYIDVNMAMMRHVSIVLNGA